VSLGLAAMALIVLDHAHWIPAPWARNVFRACAVVFFLRAVGDGNHVGFFSKKRTSRFHHWDLRLHSPLSLTLSVLFAVLAFVR
jgi:hypothetical protein